MTFAWPWPPFAWCVLGMGPPPMLLSILGPMSQLMGSITQEGSLIDGFCEYVWTTNCNKKNPLKQKTLANNPFTACFSHYHVILLFCYRVILLSRYSVILLSRYSVILLSRYSVILLSRYCVILLSPCSVILGTSLFITLSRYSVILGTSLILTL